MSRQIPNNNPAMSQDDLLDDLSNMLRNRVQEAESIEEVEFCISDCVEEWVSAYNVSVSGG